MSDADAKGFRYAFCAAISAYRNGCIPIGCAILDAAGQIVSTGENAQYALPKQDMIADHPLAHAELNAVLKTSAYRHADIKSYTLYATLEPCPLCFGAIVMGGIKHVRFSALDKDNAFASLNTSLSFIKRQNIRIEGPVEPYQTLQIAMLVCRRMKLGLPDNESALHVYQGYCPSGVALGMRFHEGMAFDLALDGCDDNARILDMFLPHHE